RWDVSKGGPFWNKYVNVNAMCEDQFGNNKTVGAKYFQRGLFDINEDTPKGLYAGFETHPVDAIFDVAEASSRAKKCGSKNGFVCFMDTEATPTLREKLCRGGK
ncbi:TPA: hypothetical protein N2F43_004674, partial [Salmonella enterica]|nr:hypothetical protein [Salmonella enterica]